MSNKTLEDIASESPNTGAPERTWYMEFKIVLIGATGNQHIKPDIDKLFRNSSVGAAWDKFIRACHEEGTILYDQEKYGDEPPTNGDVLKLLRAFDEGPAVKRLQQDMRGVP